MKASVKLRDEQEPLVRAKIPLSILGMPIRCGVSMGCSQELGLHVSTLFHAGPSCRVTFLPNHSHTPAPLCVMVKAGLGAWGSPKESCLVFSAQLNLPTTHQQHGRPSFSFCIKPRLGDFSLCKDWRGIQLPKVCNSDSQAAQPSPVSVSVAELAKVFDKQPKRFNNKNKAAAADEWQEVGLNAWNVHVNSSLPLGQRVCAGIKWRMEIPCSHKFSLPVLTVDKLSLHHHHTETQIKQHRFKSLGDADEWIHEEDQQLHKVASMCATFKRQLHLVYSENQVLKSTMEELRSSANSAVPLPHQPPGSNAAPEESRRRSNKTQSSSNEPAPSNPNSVAVAEELKRAIAATK